MTQSELADLLGISKQRICDIEKNSYHASISLCKKIAEQLDLPVEWLVKLTLQDQIKEESLKLKVS